ncbi:Acylphosphatase-like domain-containing protein [Thelephora terrestris]|uniref:acylphosphatase n=1 Tax=Thelephora terrestris TaxID=56493 RepID=A0A9P6HGT5_9AGAM|nr:Acylphosphatase-like domain-containing protein [Thelephora terrestris]
MPLRFHYTIYGDVQGVWFRRFTKQKADELGIVGWVKNDAGGSVSGVAASTSDSALDQFKRAINRGPPHATVERVDITDEREIDDVEFTSFEIRRSS